MIHVTLLQEGQLRTGGPELLEAPGPRWIDVEAPTPEEMALLQARYGLHRLAVEDVMHLNQRPKVEEYPSNIFVVLQGFSCEGDPADSVLHELHFFLGTDWLLTAHDLPSPAVQQTLKRVQDEPEATLGKGVDFVMYLVADALVDQGFPILDALNEELDGLETGIFECPDQAQLERILRLKRMIGKMRRILSPQRDAVGLLARRGTPYLSERTALYFRDVLDHAVRVQEQLDGVREMLGNAMDAYLTMVANRTNDVTKQLTIFATIFLPLSFITGFFGQNFEVLSQPHYFWLMLAVVVLFPVLLFVWFRRKKWL